MANALSGIEGFLRGFAPTFNAALKEKKASQEFGQLGDLLRTDASVLPSGQGISRGAVAGQEGADFGQQVALQPGARIIGGQFAKMSEDPWERALQTTQQQKTRNVARLEKLEQQQVEKDNEVAQALQSDISLDAKQKILSLSQTEKRKTQGSIDKLYTSIDKTNDKISDIGIKKTEVQSKKAATIKARTQKIEMELAKNKIQLTPEEDVLPDELKEKLMLKKISQSPTSEERKLTAKKEDLKNELTSFFALDDVIQEARAKGPFSRLFTSPKLFLQRAGQIGPTGVIAASHDAAKKRLRVKLVRAAGDVGNINIVEQTAAEMILPSIFDTQPVAELKRSFLEQIGSQQDDANKVKILLDRYIEQADPELAAVLRTKARERLKLIQPKATSSGVGQIIIPNSGKFKGKRLRITKVDENGKATEFDFA